MFDLVIIGRRTFRFDLIVSGISSRISGIGKAEIVSTATQILFQGILFAILSGIDLDISGIRDLVSVSVINTDDKGSHIGFDLKIDLLILGYFELVIVLIVGHTDHTFDQITEHDIVGILDRAVVFVLGRTRLVKIRYDLVIAGRIVAGNLQVVCTFLQIKCIGILTGACAAAQFLLCRFPDPLIRLIQLQCVGLHIRSHLDGKLSGFIQYKSVIIIVIRIGDLAIDRLPRIERIGIPSIVIPLIFRHSKSPECHPVEHRIQYHSATEHCRSGQSQQAAFPFLHVFCTFLS